MNEHKINFLKTWYEKVVLSNGTITANHTSIMMYAIHAYQESGNKEIFDFSPTECMAFAGIKSYNTFKKHLHELQYDLGMIEVHVKAVNQYVPYQVSLARFEQYEYKMQVEPHPNSLPPDMVQSYQNNKLVLDRMKKLEADQKHTRAVTEKILDLLQNKEPKKERLIAEGKEPYWKQIVSAYFDFYKSNIVEGETPDWDNDTSESTAMKQLVKKIKGKVLNAFNDGEVNQEIIWDENSAPWAVVTFLQATIALQENKRVNWYKQNFSIRIINHKFHELYVALQEKRKSTRNKANDGATTNQRIDDLFAKRKTKSGG